MARCGPRVLCHITLNLGSGPCPRDTLRESKGLFEAERWASGAAASGSVADAGSRRLHAVVIWSHDLPVMLAPYCMAHACLIGGQLLHANCAATLLTISQVFLFTLRYMNA